MWTGALAVLAKKHQRKHLAPCSVWQKCCSCSCSGDETAVELTDLHIQRSMWGTERVRWAEKAKTGMGTELSQHVRGEEILEWGAEGVDAEAEKTQRGGGAGGREGGVSHLYVMETARGGEREGNEYGRCFFFPLNWGDVTLSVAGSWTLWREGP